MRRGRERGGKGGFFIIGKNIYKEVWGGERISINLEE